MASVPALVGQQNDSLREAFGRAISQIAERDQKIVVFGKHKAVVDLLKKEYPKAVTVTGQDNEHQNSYHSWAVYIRYSLLPGIFKQSTWT